MTNPVLDTIAQRYSCRSFDGRRPSREQLEAVARAAIQSPSALNRQPWQVLVVEDSALMADLEAAATGVLAAMEDQSTYNRIQERGGKLFYNAPALIMLPLDSRVGGSALDCGIVAQTVALAAHSVGLASVICGLAACAFQSDRGPELAQRLGFPQGYEFGMAVLLGFATAPGTPHQPNPEKIRWL